MICLGLILLSARMQAQSAGTAAATRNTAGLLSGMILRPLGFDDPYSWMVGAGAFYERRLGESGALVLGGRAAVYGQYAMEPLYGWSLTALGGPYVGWEILRRPAADLTFTIVPYVGCVQYWRRFEYDNADYRASRLALVLGVNLDVLLGSRVVCGAASEPMLILDRDPLLTLGQIQRLAVRF